MTAQQNNKPHQWLNMIKQFEQDLRIALAFMTRIPVPYPMDQEGKPTSRSLAEASWSFPLIGILVGFISATVLVISFYLSLPLYVCALLAIIASILATGALHEDGLADVADGFGGSHDLERKLEIMKDSRVGSYGVLALGISVLMRTLLLGSLLSLAQLSPLGADNYQWAILIQIFAIYISAHMIGRGLAPLMMSHLPLAKKSGMAATAAKPKLRSSYGSLLLTMVFLFLFLPPLSVLIVLVSNVLMVLFLSWLTMRQIGGYTGDVLGTAVQLCEIVTYLALLSYIA
ncbi:adenosylcobinamide-GDP ribazoletransferase [Kiloniella litopenaei]|uniref:adenosylcobinamide-GDP ribazoletransferase n=1 Tax=Kiloniella litopenaei TaxID=1549748 RepID=UPI003BA854BA